MTLLGVIIINKFEKEKRRKNFLLLAFILLCISLIVDLRLRPIIKTVASNKAQTISIHAINEAVLQELDESNTKCSDLVLIEKADDGRIVALTTNSRVINQLKSKISVAIQDRLSQSEINRASIPLGTLLGAEILSGWGPSIPLKISISGSVVTEFTSSFCDAGINQTKHQIYLNIHTKISALIPGYPSDTNVDTNIEIAETIIVGSVPNVYATGGNSELHRAEALERSGK